MTCKWAGCHLPPALEKLERPIIKQLAMASCKSITQSTHSLTWSNDALISATWSWLNPSIFHSELGNATLLSRAGNYISNGRIAGSVGTRQGQKQTSQQDYQLWYIRVYCACSSWCGRALKKGEDLACALHFKSTLALQISHLSSIYARADPDISCLTRSLTVGQAWNKRSSLFTLAKMPFKKNK